MTPILLNDITFWDIIWYMIIIFFWMLVFWMFISIFADIFRRQDISGWLKAFWILVICFLPLLGILFYLIFRPADATREQDMEMMQQQMSRLRVLIRRGNREGERAPQVRCDHPGGVRSDQGPCDSLVATRVH